MSSIRTTERSLTLLAFNTKTFGGGGRLGTGKRASYGASSNLSQTSNYQPKRFLSNGVAMPTTRFAYKPRIKCFSRIMKPSDSKMLSTVKPLADIPLLNPNKANFGEGKELILPPLAMPRTLPTFPRGLTQSVPSVTKVLQATMPAASRFLLDRWKESMIKKLGAEGFSQYQKDTFERGRALHAVLANYLLGSGQSPTKEALSQEVVNNLWKSIKSVVHDKINNVRLVEHIVTHSDMNYRGIVDCVAFYENELVVIDFKTAEKPKNNVESLYDNPLQVTAYCGAINNDPNIPTNVIDRNICSGLVIVAYVDGSAASTYYLNSEQITDKYWKQWKTRLDQYTRMEELRKQQEQGK